MEDYIKMLQEKRQSSSDFWNYSASGNSIEIIVIPSLKKDPNNYRIGVIQAGSIIQQCRFIMLDQASPPLIQIFPNLMENELIAIFQFSSTIKTPPLKQALRSKKKSLQIDRSLFSIKEVTERNQLEFLDIPKNSFIICTHAENAFSWLNVGHQAEILKEELKQKGGFNSCTSYILKNEQEQKAITPLFTEKLTPQMIIF